MQRHLSACRTGVHVKLCGADGIGSPSFTSTRLLVGVPKMLCS